MKKFWAVAGLFSAALLGSLLWTHQDVQPSETEAKGVEESSPGLKALPVILAKAEPRRFLETVKVHGNLMARNFALVSPRTPGVIEKVFVREGDDAVEGKTPLFQIDSLKATKNYDIARQNLQVARYSKEERKAYNEQVEAELRKAKGDFQRYRSLYERKGTSLEDLEEKRMEFEKQNALRKHAVSLLRLAQEEERKAEIALAIAEKDIRDTRALAPITGKVSKRLAEPGEMGSPGKPVIRIDDVSAVEASAHLPGQFYDRIVPGVTKVKLGAGDHWWGEFALTYKSPTVDPSLRTFEVKCDLKGDGERIVPGKLVEMAVVLADRKGLGVPFKAVVNRKQGQVVFLVRDDRAKEEMIQTGLETEGWLEVTSGRLSSGDPVVVEGQFMLNDGQNVVVQEGQ